MRITQHQVLKLLEAAQNHFSNAPSPDEDTGVLYELRLSRWKHHQVCSGYLRIDRDTGELFTRGKCDCTRGQLINAIEAIIGEWK